MNGEPGLELTLRISSDMGVFVVFGITELALDMATGVDGGTRAGVVFVARSELLDVVFASFSYIVVSKSCIDS